VIAAPHLNSSKIRANPRPARVMKNATPRLPPDGLIAAAGKKFYPQGTNLPLSPFAS
jgi:hypothetical protein